MNNNFTNANFINANRTRGKIANAISAGLALALLCCVQVGCGTSGGGTTTPVGQTNDAASTDGAANDGTSAADSAGVTEDGGSTGGDTAKGEGDGTTGSDAPAVKVLEDNDKLCLDGIDNDDNGYTDCDDFSCSKSDKVTVCNFEDTDDKCKDGLDNDGNGYTDCEDVNCNKNDKVTVCGGGGTGKCGDGKCADGETEKTCPKDCAKSGPNSCVGKCGEFSVDGNCQCDDGCEDFDDCCNDYKAVCGNNGGGGGGSCKGLCGTFVPDAKCQCDSGCADFDDCCTDYVELCGGTTSTTSPDVSVVITELMIRSQSGEDDGEYIELHNPASATVDLDGFELVYKGSTKLKLSKKAGKTTISGGGYLVIGRSKDASKNHGAPVDYAQKLIGLGNGGGDLALKVGGATVDAVKYPKTAVEIGKAWQLSAGKLDAKSNDSEASWCLSTATYGTGGKSGSPGATNAACK